MGFTFDKFRNAEFLGVRELSDAAEQLIREFGSSQDKGTVAEFPNERTVRFYIAEGLLPPADSKRGSASVFGFIHLLSLLVIKKLQSNGLPITIIRQLVEQKTAAELEQILGEEVRVKVINDAEEIRRLSVMDEDELGALYGERVMKIDAPLTATNLINSPAPKNKATEFLERLLQLGSGQKDSDRRTGAGPKLSLRSMSLGPPAANVPAPAAARKDQRNWTRYKIADGVELHISEDSEVSARPSEIQTVIQMIKRLLKVR